jgi:hypothetical protein
LFNRCKDIGVAVAKPSDVERRPRIITHTFRGSECVGGKIANEPHTSALAVDGAASTEAVDGAASTEVSACVLFR